MHFNSNNPSVVFSVVQHTRQSSLHVCAVSDPQVQASEPFLFGLVEEESDGPRRPRTCTTLSSEFMTNFYTAFIIILTFLMEENVIRGCNQSWAVTNDMLSGLQILSTCN